MCCAKVKEYKVADLVFEHENLYYALEDIHAIISKCLEFDRGTAYITNEYQFARDWEKEQAWHRIDIDDLKQSWKWSQEETATLLIYDLIVSWGENVDQWESSNDPIDDMAELQREL